MGIAYASLRCCLLPREQEQPPLQIPSGETPDILPNDLIFDILSRVPVKSLCRLRCVSREWCALISGPEFAAAHRCRRPAEPLLVVTSYPDKSLRLIDMDGCLVQVINDMGKYWTPVCTGPDDALCVTGYHAAIGCIAGVIDLATMNLLATRLECKSWEKRWGFGRAVPSGTCKVVRFTARESDVFTIGDGAGWRRRKPHPSWYDYYNFNLDTVVANGVLHFLAATQPDGHISVLRFDLEREEWKDTIKGPLNVNIRPTKIRVAELDGAFCLVEPDNWELIRGHMNIWLLGGSDNSTWVKAYTIPFDPAKYYQMVPLGVIDEGSKLLLRIIPCGGTRPILHIYDSRYGTCIDATKNLLRGHVSTDNYNISMGLCNMRLEHFLSPKIQRLSFRRKKKIQCLSTLSEVFI